MKQFNKKIIPLVLPKRTVATRLSTTVPEGMDPVDFYTQRRIIPINNSVAIPRDQNEGALSENEINSINGIEKKPVPSWIKKMFEDYHPENENNP
jgi:hypothetical protein